MKLTRVISLVLGAAAVTSLAACDANNPARPSVTFVAPVAQGPSNGINYNFNQQPVTLTIVNSVKTGSATVTYNVEVSKSSTFEGTAAFTKNDIPEGGSGTTTVTLTQLDGNTTYYWRWRAVIDGVQGEPSAAQSFFVRPNIVLNVPVASSPVGVTVFSARPTFTITNATRTGPAGAIFYEFQISTSDAFTSTVASATIQEQAGGTTSYTPSSDLPLGNLFWRVRATDPANVVTGAYSGALMFDRRAGIDLTRVAYDLGPDISGWPETRVVDDAYHVGDQECIFTSGEDWPAAPFPFDPDVAVEGNIWNFVLVNGIWHGAAGHWYRPGQSCKGEVDENFFIEGFQRAQPISSIVLHDGDTFGIMQSTPARTWPSPKTLDHRSNVVIIVW